MLNIIDKVAYLPNLTTGKCCVSEIQVIEDLFRRRDFTAKLVDTRTKVFVVQECFLECTLLTDPLDKTIS